MLRVVKNLLIIKYLQEPRLNDFKRPPHRGVEFHAVYELFDFLSVTVLPHLLFVVVELHGFLVEHSRGNLRIALFVACNEVQVIHN